MNSLPGPPMLPPHSGQTQFKMLEIRSPLVRSVVNSTFSISTSQSTTKYQPPVMCRHRGDSCRDYAPHSNSPKLTALGLCTFPSTTLVTDHRRSRDFLAANDATGGLCSRKFSWKLHRGRLSTQCGSPLVDTRTLLGQHHGLVDIKYPKNRRVDRCCSIIATTCHES